MSSHFLGIIKLCSLLIFAVIINSIEKSDLLLADINSLNKAVSDRHVAKAVWNGFKCYLCHIWLHNKCTDLSEKAIDQICKLDLPFHCMRCRFEWEQVLASIILTSNPTPKSQQEDCLMSNHSPLLMIKIHSRREAHQGRYVKFVKIWISRYRKLDHSQNGALELVLL